MLYSLSKLFSHGKIRALQAIAPPRRFVSCLIAALIHELKAVSTKNEIAICLQGIREGQKNPKSDPMRHCNALNIRQLPETDYRTCTGRYSQFKFIREGLIWSAGPMVLVQALPSYHCAIHGGLTFFSLAAVSSV